MLQPLRNLSLLLTLGTVLLLLFEVLTCFALCPCADKTLQTKDAGTYQFEELCIR